MGKRILEKSQKFRTLVIISPLHGFEFIMFKIFSNAEESQSQVEKRILSNEGRSLIGYILD